MKNRHLKIRVNCLTNYFIRDGLKKYCSICILRCIANIKRRCISYWRSSCVFFRSEKMAATSCREHMSVFFEITATEGTIREAVQRRSGVISLSRPAVPLFFCSIVGCDVRRRFRLLDVCSAVRRPTIIQRWIPNAAAMLTLSNTPPAW